MKIRLILFVVAIVFTSIARAGLSVEAQNLVIKKLTRVFLELPEDDKSKVRVTLRLADLHAERGRALARQELEKNCVECTNGEPDRKKALKYYNYVLPKIKGSGRKNVLVHIGHLYEILGQSGQATKFYKKVIREAGVGKSSAEAHFSLAEIYFKKRRYAMAKGHYTAALNSKEFTRRGLAEYRTAWCLYNSGQVNPAVKKLERILNNPKLMTRGGESIVNKDDDFQAEVAKDYTIFVAHKSQLNMDQVKSVYELSPESAKLENVSFLAKELERLGKVSSATQAWEMVVRKTAKPAVRMEGLVYLAGLEMKKNNRDKILSHLERAFQNWRSLSSCKDKQCDELRKRIRRIVLDWNRAEKKNPSPELLQAYQGYMSVAGEDAEMTELGTQVAMSLKDYKVAQKWSGIALKGAIKDKKKDKLEQLLLKRIEIAELAKKDVWLENAQKDYLAKSSMQGKNSEIHYQIAQKNYDDKKYEEASNQFKNLATNKKTPRKLREQSAELALDALVLLKQDIKIESWSKEFTKLFPNKRAHFGKISRTSVLSQTAKIVGGESSSNTKAWKTLSRFNVRGASTEEKITYYKNKAILARKLKKYNDLKSSVNFLLKLPVTAEDRQFAYENKLWVSEIQLDFHQALRSYSKLKTTKPLEMARLADLAEKNSKPFYIKYLKANTDPELSKAICDRLLTEAGQITNSLRTCIPHLKNDKTWFASLQMHFLSKHRNFARFERDMKRNDLMETGAGQLITRKNEISKVELSLVKLQKHRLDGRSSRVARSIKQRVAKITRFENKIKAPTESGDWYLQTYLLSNLQKEYKRFYDDLIALPMPPGLAELEQQEYLTILSQQASPYKAKSDDISLKLKDLWANDKAIDQMFADYHKANRYLQKVLNPQIAKIHNMAPESHKGWFNYVQRKNAKKKLPSLAVLERARTNVKTKPLDKSALRDLILLEKKRGYQPMVMYLESRLQRIDEGFEKKKR